MFVNWDGKEALGLCEQCQGDWRNCLQPRRGRVLVGTRCDVPVYRMCKSFRAACESGEYKPTVEDFPNLDGMMQSAERSVEKCKECKGLMDCKNHPRGTYRSIVWNPTGSDFIEKFFGCKHYWAEQRMNELMRALGRTEVGARFENRELDNFSVDLLNPTLEAALIASMEYVDAYTSKTQDGLLLQGPWGVGKTHLAVGIAKGVARKGFEARFMPVVDMARRFGTSYQDDSTERYVQEMYDAGLLIIDDLGKEKSSDTTRSFIYSVINHRYEKGKPTIITTNLSSDDIAVLYDGAVLSRILEMCKVIVMRGGDMRRAALERR